MEDQALSEDYAVPNGYVEGIGCFPIQGTKGEQIRYINDLVETKQPKPEWLDEKYFEKFSYFNGSY